MTLIFKTVIPNDMTFAELVLMKHLLKEAKNKKQDYAIVKLPYGDYKNPVNRLDDYVNTFTNKRVYVINLDQSFLNYYATLQVVGKDFAEIITDDGIKKIVSIKQLEFCK